MSRYRHHKYTWTKPFSSTRHNWELVTPDGAIHFHYSETANYEPTAGLEIHRCIPADYQFNEAPHHINCPLTGGRCWHDGTSLYATEHLLPLISSYVQVGDHAAIFRILEAEAAERFGYSTEDAEAA